MPVSGDSPVARYVLHGGRLHEAARRYGIAVDAWLDLSTGISPLAFPVDAIPPHAWHRLPEDEDGLLSAARDYYGAPSLCALPGSQAAVQVLPHLRARSRVVIPVPTYAEHAKAWLAAGHDVQCWSVSKDLEALPAQTDVLVVVNPNNPTAHTWDRHLLLRLHARLAERGGWLVVDEAFMDPTPNQSIVDVSDRPGLIVLRSLGKFFGLAGARVGFVAATAGICEQITAAVGPWPIAGPSRHVAMQALASRDWQHSAREQLVLLSARLAALLDRHRLGPSGRCDLFHWVLTQQAVDLHQALARQGILTRLFVQPAALRIGLPESTVAMERLDRALRTITDRSHV